MTPDIQIMKTLLESPIPNQKIASGINATGGIGLIISNIGLVKPLKILNHPIINPKGIPIPKARM